MRVYRGARRGYLISDAPGRSPYKDFGANANFGKNRGQPSSAPQRRAARRSTNGRRRSTLHEGETCQPAGIAREPARGGEGASEIKAISVPSAANAVTVTGWMRGVNRAGRGPQTVRRSQPSVVRRHPPVAVAAGLAGAEGH